MSNTYINNQSAATASTRGLGALGLIWVGLIFCKIFEVPALAGWSWLAIITFPLWASIAILLAIAAIMAIGFGLWFGVMLLFAWISDIRAKRRLKKQIKIVG